MLRRSQVDSELGKALVVVGISLMVEDAHQVLLARLAEGEAIERTLALEPEFALLVLAEREGWDPAFDLGVAWISPPRPQVVHVGLAAQLGGCKGCGPGVGSLRPQRLFTVCGSDVLADGVALEAMDPTLALFEVRWSGAAATTFYPPVAPKTLLLTAPARFTGLVLR